MASATTFGVHGVTVALHRYGPVTGGLRSTRVVIEFRILGPFEVVADGRPVRLAGAKERALLALLLLHASETLTADRLVDELWGEEPPRTARKSLQVRVAGCAGRSARASSSPAARPMPSGSSRTSSISGSSSS